MKLKIKNLTSKLSLLFFNLLGGILILISEGTYANEYKLKVHHFLTTNAVTHKDLLVPWTEKINRLSDGQLDFSIYPSMQLGGKPQQLFDQARRGTVDIAWTLAGYTPGRFPRMEVFELPFMAANAEITSQAAYEFYSKYATEEFKDVKVLLVHSHAPGKFHMKNKPIRNLQDMKGTKIRAPTRVANLMLNSLGATAVGMPVPEIPSSIAKGVIDGALVPYEVSFPLRLHELTDSHTDVVSKRGLYTAIFLLVMNKKKFESLPTKLQLLLEDNSDIKWAKEAGQLWDRSDLPGIIAAQERDHAFYFIQGKELERWKAIGKQVEDKWIEEMRAKDIDGAGLIKQARRLIAKYESSD